ncbi:peptide-methionine (R)-S-oxide reductase MsrB [Bosea sp. TAF32]|uniref:peptide-methionine (R)-S-oxide reductase MsrB n=1 Tax=Bosea sp. TAF32 TaxID=3237482 RepID=UPI003F929C7F
MITRRILLAAMAAGTIGVGVTRRPRSASAAEDYTVKHSEAEWRKLLTPEQYAVLRQSATERPYTSPLNQEKRRGTFACAGCDQELFSSTTKFESGTGWPSFWAPISDKAVGTERDTSLSMVRVAAHCGRCGGHLGHVFDDGPRPTGLRYCMNGVAMAFRPLAA